MQFPQDLNFKTSTILKIAGLVILALIILAIAFRLVFFAFQGVSTSSNKEMMYDSAPSYGMTSQAINLSLRNAVDSMEEMDGDVVMGNDSEAYEIKEYNANIETRNLENTCSKVAGLKARKDVIFENSREYEKSCYYSFKVESGSVEEVLALIESLDPRELNENAYTIKELVDDYTSEVEILEKKMASIESTLSSAITAYDEITVVAKNARDAESLATIIDSKVRIIEKLTQEKINITAQLDRLSRAKAEQLDRLAYTYFSVNVSEIKYVDGQALKDSWRSAVRSFVREFNRTLQDLSINLVLVLVKVIQFAVYALIVLLVLKYGWRVAKLIWRK